MLLESPETSRTRGLFRAQQRKLDTLTRRLSPFSFSCHLQFLLCEKNSESTSHVIFLGVK